MHIKPQNTINKDVIYVSKMQLNLKNIFENVPEPWQPKQFLRIVPAYHIFTDGNDENNNVCLLLEEFHVTDVRNR